MTFNLSIFYICYLNTSESKIKLVQLIVKSEDISFISQMLEYAHLLNEGNDWALNIPSEVYDEIKLAIEEADKGIDLGTPHSQTISKYKEKYPSR